MAMIRMNDADLHKRVKVKAAAEGVTVEAFVADACRAALNGHGKAPAKSRPDRSRSALDKVPYVAVSAAQLSKEHSARKPRAR